MGNDEKYARKFEKPNKERFEVLKNFVRDNGLVEKCYQPGHKHEPGAHETISELGAQIWMLLCQFVSSEEITRIAWAKTMEDFEDEFGVDIEDIMLHMGRASRPQETEH